MEFNPGAQPESSIDAWLREGGLVVAASDRAARTLRSAFHRARQAEGLRAWPAPVIVDWNSFIRSAWAERSLDGRLLLNRTQETELWVDIAGRDPQPSTVLPGPRHRLAAMAMDAHELLATHAPRYLRTASRSGWQQDAEAFSRWLASFDDACRDMKLISESCLPLELIPLLQADSSQRPQLLLAGFDRLLPVQCDLLDAWGAWRQAAPGDPAVEIQFHQADDAQAELAACALWCKGKLAANPHARLLIITQDAATRRGEIERALLRHTSSASAPVFEFSLGVPLASIPLARSAYLLLRWVTASIAEHELDWLLSTGHAAATVGESAALQATMRRLRHRGMERPAWPLAAFIEEGARTRQLPPAWVARMSAAKRRLDDRLPRPRSPLDWAALVPELLQAAAWSGDRPLSSAEFQAIRRWDQALDSCASLGFNGRRMAWGDFLSALGRALDETLFAPESRDAPIQIAGPAESAGLTADALWFLGVSEDAWPPHGSIHPLLPIEVQREAAMPHATPQLDWELARAITARLLASASEVRFSFARQSQGIEARPSRLVVTFAGASQPLPPELAAPSAGKPLTVAVEDAARIPFVAVGSVVAGGAGILTAQSQCPFKAFATARLGAGGWQPAEAGLSPSQRGQLLHAVLHAIWGGPPHGLRSHEELKTRNDLQGFVIAHVRSAIGQLSAGLRERMPRRYLDLEERRLVRLVSDWLAFEATRHAFNVMQTELDKTTPIAGLTLRLRLDRVDRLNDGTVLVIDYKSGNVSPKVWDLPRPEDVQLPLYATLAREAEEEELGGLVFAKVRPGDLCFAGRVGNAQATLLADLSRGCSLVKDPLGAEHIIDWQNAIKQLAQDFLDGKADVDPRDPPKTCERCGLQTLCRIGGAADESDSGDAGDEGGSDE